MERGRRKVRIGRVVSNKMDKTIVVAVEDSYVMNYTTNLLKELKSLRHTTKITNVESEIE